MAFDSDYDATRTAFVQPPRLVPILETTSTGSDAWTQVDVERPSILRAPPGAPHNTRYRPTTADATAIADGRYYFSETGVCYFLVPGKWWVNAPTTGTPATINYVLLDAVSAQVAQSLATVEDPSAWTSKFEPRVMGSPLQNADVDTASESLVAAEVGRRFLYIRNTSTGGQTISLGFGVAAESGKGIILTPNEWVSFDALTGITEQAVNVISDANNATVAYQTGT